jgi:hypothetical protein
MRQKDRAPAFRAGTKVRKANADPHSALIAVAISAQDRSSTRPALPEFAQDHRTLSSLNASEAGLNGHRPISLGPYAACDIVEFIPYQRFVGFSQSQNKKHAVAVVFHRVTSPDALLIYLS